MNLRITLTPEQAAQAQPMRTALVSTTIVTTGAILGELRRTGPEEGSRLYLDMHLLPGHVALALRECYRQAMTEGPKGKEKRRRKA